jgi:hypothetical protein
MFCQSADLNSKTAARILMSMKFILLEVTQRITFKYSAFGKNNMVKAQIYMLRTTIAQILR